MRNLSIIFAMLFFGITLYAQNETVSYFLNDGSIKTYNLNDIADVSTQNSSNEFEMKIYIKGAEPVSYSSNMIDSAKYGRDANNNYVYIVYSGANQYSYILANIDSISYNNNTNIENTVTIGNQIWMTRNLNVDHYRNGDPIPQVTDATQWASLTTGAWCYNYNDSAIGAIYGKLYNWYAVSDPRGLAPMGYHVPSDTEWTTLSNCLGGETIAGGKLKTVGTIEDGTGLWYSPNSGATNSTGFSGLPCGSRDYSGTFDNIGGNEYWWSSTKSSYNSALHRVLSYAYATLPRHYGVYMTFGFSVRCVKD